MRSFRFLLIHLLTTLANLRVLGIGEIKSIPYAPISHPFIERLIGTVRREYLDQFLFWTATEFTLHWTVKRRAK